MQSFLPHRSPVSCWKVVDRLCLVLPLRKVHGARGVAACPEDCLDASKLPRGVLSLGKVMRNLEAGSFEP